MSAQKEVEEGEVRKVGDEVVEMTCAQGSSLNLVWELTFRQDQEECAAAPVCVGVCVIVFGGVCEKVCVAAGVCVLVLARICRLMDWVREPFCGEKRGRGSSVSSTYSPSESSPSLLVGDWSLFVKDGRSFTFPVELSESLQGLCII